jgi:hypothetical protein
LTKKKEVTRYGAIKQTDLKFGSEKRFMWQNASNSNDVVYELPEMTSTRSVIFGSSLRIAMDEENPDNKKRSTGPGSYDFAPCFDHNSEYAIKQGTRFACAARQSMALKTPSPGAVYNIEKQYWNGPEKSEGIGFVNAPRQNLYCSSLGANADMFFPKFDTGPCITISKRFKAKRDGNSTPGPIYDVHVSFICLSFSFSFIILLFHRKKLILELVHRILLAREKEIDLKRLDICLKFVIDKVIL